MPAADMHNAALAAQSHFLLKVGSSRHFATYPGLIFFGTSDLPGTMPSIPPAPQHCRQHSAHAASPDGAMKTATTSQHWHDDLVTGHADESHFNATIY